MERIENPDAYKKFFKYINFFILHVIGFSLMYKYDTQYNIKRGPGIGAILGVTVGSFIGLVSSLLFASNIGAFFEMTNYTENMGIILLGGLLVGACLGILIGSLSAISKHVLKFPYLINTKNNLEILGVGLTIGANILMNTFLFADIVNSPKSYDFVVYIFIAGILGLFVAEIFTLMTLTNIHQKYKLKGSHIQFTRENRERFNNLKALLITCILIISVLAMMYFTLPATTGTTPFEPFYCFNGGCNIAYSGFKVLLSLALMGITGYLIYLAYKFSKLRKSQLTNVHIEKDDRDYAINKTPGFYENINMNFLSGYKLETGL